MYKFNMFCSKSGGFAVKMPSVSGILSFRAVIFDKAFSATGNVGTLAACLAGLSLLACSTDSESSDAYATTAEIVAAYPHDRDAFTQGLVIHEGRLFEGTGQYGRSSLREVDLASGQVQRIAPLNRAYFGEGVTIMGDRVFQLTWQNGVGAIYDLESFEVTGVFRYAGEGWGLTHDGEYLILSDGTPTLRFLEPEDFSVVREVEVTGPNGPVARLNELEYINGEVWANIWYEDRIVRINPETGAVVGTIDVSGIYPAALRSSEEVANGIAYDERNGKIFVTGKNWPQLFEIRLVPAETS
jgi:glutamine cyclotransferase